MGNAKSALKKWAIDFLRSKDAFFRKIAKIDDHSIDFTVTYKDGKEQRHFILPTLDAAIQALSTITPHRPIAIITLSNRANRQKLAELWKSLTPYKLLTIYFVNPFSSQEKKWVLMPHVHDKVCDGASLAAGFNSLSELVEDISEEEAAAKA
jgi:hypothetical protein